MPRSLRTGNIYFTLLKLMFRQYTHVISLARAITWIFNIRILIRSEFIGGLSCLKHSYPAGIEYYPYPEEYRDNPYLSCNPHDCFRYNKWHG